MIEPSPNREAPISDLFRLLIENVSDHAIFTMDPEGLITSWNVAAERILGHRETEILGQPFAVIFTPEDVQNGRPQQRLVVSNAESGKPEEGWHIRKGGERFWASSVVTLTYDASGRQTGFAKILRDMTERKLAEQALQRAYDDMEAQVRDRTAELLAANERLQHQIAERQQAEARKSAILDASLDAIVTVDHLGIIVEFNPAAETILGHTRAHAVGQAMAELLLPPHLREWYHRDLARYQTTGDADIFGKRCELSALRADGTEFPIELAVTPIRGPGPTMFTGFLRDITERRQAERRLIVQHTATKALAESPDLETAVPPIIATLGQAMGWAWAGVWIPDASAHQLTLAHYWHSPSAHVDEFLTASHSWAFRRGEGLPGRVWATGEPIWVPDVMQDEQLLRRVEASKCGLHGAVAFPILFGRHIFGVMEFFSQRIGLPDEETFGLMAAISGQIGQFIERKRTEAGLRLFRALIDHTIDGIEVIDPTTGLFLDVNEQACTTHGYTRDEYLSLTVADLDPVTERADGWGVDPRCLLGPCSFETLHRRKDGSTFPVEINTNLIHLERDYLVAVVRDVSQRKHAEATLARDARILANVRDAVIVTDPRGVVTYWNDGATWLFGWTAAEMLGRHYADRYPESERTAVTEEMRRRVGGEEWVGEYQERRKDGSRVWIDACISRITDATGHLTGVLGVSHDISPRKRAERALQASEQRYRVLIAATTAIDWNTGANGEFETPQQSWLVFTGQTFEQLRGWGWLNAVHADDRAATAQAWRTALAERSIYRVEHRLRRSDGVYRRMAVQAVPLMQPDGTVREWFGVHTDVHEHRQAEIERNALLAQLDLQIQRLPLAYLLSGPDLRFTRWNPAAEQLFGFSEAEVLGKHPFEVIIPPAAQSIVETIFERVRAGDMGAHGVCENVTREGRTITCEWHNTPLMDHNGQFVGLISLAQDITSRRQAERELLLRDRAIQAVTQGILITDPNQADNPIIFASPSFERLTGYRADEAIGRNCRFLQGKDTDPAMLEKLRRAVRYGEFCMVELLNSRKDGSAFWNELSVAPVRDADGQLMHFIGVLTDVTQKRQLEAQFRQAQKMEAFGQLAGGVAHDFNNLLTIISGYSEMMIDNLPPDNHNHELAQEIHRAGERATLLTRQLLAFSRKQVVEMRVFNLNDIVAGMERMLARLIGEDVVMRTVLTPGLDRMKADPGQVEQVIMNLVVNARDAMPQGGKITIETANVELDVGYLQSHAEVVPGRHVMLVVSDTGSGMTAEVQRHIFEPFFTTKDVGKGTGLGLATVFGIVKQSGGHIWVYSEVGHGTTFKIYFPAVAEDVSRKRPEPMEGRAFTGTETVLVVEDDPAVRTMTRFALRTKGYTVLEAGGGQEAIRLCEQHTAPIQLLVSDVVMPEIGGRQLAERLTTLHPEMRVLFVSGYTDDAIVRHGVLEADVAFLQKPFSMDALHRKVRAVLDGTR